MAGHVVITGKVRAPAGSGPNCNPQGRPLVLLPAHRYTPKVLQLSKSVLLPWAQALKHSAAAGVSH